MENKTSTMKQKDDILTKYDDIFDNPYYVYTKKMLCFYGQWPFQSNIERFIRTTLFLFFASTLLIPMSVALVMSWQEIDLFMEGLTCVLTGYGASSKIIAITFNTTKLRLLIEEMRDYWESERQSSMALKIFHEFGKKGRFYIVSYSLAINIMMAAWVSVPISGIVLDCTAPLNYSRHRLVFQAVYGVDNDKYYTLLFIHACGICFAVMQGYVAHDTLYIILSLHVCATIDVLRYVQLMERTCEWPLGLTITLNVMAMSCTGAMAVAKSTVIEDVIKFACLNFAQFGHLLSITLPGHWIMESSSLIPDSVYSCNWYIMSIKTRKLIVLFLRRSREPCTITAGRYYVMSMENFSAVLQTSMSYIAMLSSLQ